jgi:DNA polymerase III subunit alpha
LTAPGEGEVSLVLILGPHEGEVEIRLPGRYSVSAAIAGALKAAPGVVAVEQV